MQYIYIDRFFLEKLFSKFFPSMCVAQDIHLFPVTNIHSIQKRTKQGQNPRKDLSLDDDWNFKSQKREIKLISKDVWEKRTEKLFQKGSWLMLPVTVI